MDTTFLSARQAAERLGVSKAYVCRLFSQGRIPAQKVDTDWIAKAKDVNAYLDDKAGIPMYYRDTDGWERDDYYFLYRVLDKMLHDRKGRYEGEIGAIEASRLSGPALTMLAAMKAGSRVAGMETMQVKPFSPPLILTDYPSAGAFPEFEKWGMVL